ncbi:MAG: hypothetical protein EZS28_049137 [Streblomastix strix]|uniref:Uncharacterized protein n=1 Tax=Streblomastix strix TaxID=222440 RepID=A0A5J4TAR9_9EUKA|nr:MAG: hypothetical protein EZS28_049137 [Streblomastix strix]
MNQIPNPTGEIQSKMRLDQIQRKVCMSTQQSLPDKVINRDGINNSQMSEGAGGSQFPMKGKQLNEYSCQQSIIDEFEWLQGFYANCKAPELLQKIKSVKQLQKQILKGYNKMKLENLDMTGVAGGSE